MHRFCYAGMLEFFIISFGSFSIFPSGQNFIWKLLQQIASSENDNFLFRFPTIDLCYDNCYIQMILKMKLWLNVHVFPAAPCIV